LVDLTPQNAQPTVTETGISEASALLRAALRKAVAERDSLRAKLATAEPVLAAAERVRETKQAADERFAEYHAKREQWLETKDHTIGLKPYEDALILARSEFASAQYDCIAAALASAPATPTEGK
jgi:UPF0288 family protein (methanogenesis marker protein 3)